MVKPLKIDAMVARDNATRMEPQDVKPEAGVGVEVATRIAPDPEKKKENFIQNVHLFKFVKMRTSWRITCDGNCPGTIGKNCGAT